MRRAYSANRTLFRICVDVFCMLATWKLNKRRLRLSSAMPSCASESCSTIEDLWKKNTFIRFYVQSGGAALVVRAVDLARPSGEQDCRIGHSSWFEWGLYCQRVTHKIRQNRRVRTANGQGVSRPKIDGHVLLSSIRQYTTKLNAFSFTTEWDFLWKQRFFSRAIGKTYSCKTVATPCCLSGMHGPCQWHAVKREQNQTRSQKTISDHALGFWKPLLANSLAKIFQPNDMATFRTASTHSSSSVSNRSVEFDGEASIGLPKARRYRDSPSFSRRIARPSCQCWLVSASPWHAHTNVSALTRGWMDVMTVPLIAGR